MNNIEELKSAYRDVELTARNMRGKPEEYRVVTGFCPVNVVEMQAQKIQALIAQLEEAQKESAIRLEAIEQMRKTVAHNVDRAEKAEAALSAANEKLSKPVVLPQGTGWASDPYNHGRNDGIQDCKVALKEAGFTVEGEPAPVKYIVILQRAWCNDSGSGINYHSDLIEFDKRDKAIKYGFELQDSDDFNIGVLTNGVLTSFDWMAKPLAETKDSLARIANRIGIEGNADAE